MTEDIRNYRINSLNKIESQLSQYLQPVKPDTDFVNTLKSKLIQVPTMVVESTKKGSKYLVVGLGILAGIIALWLIGRSKKEDPD
jgi:hypothetical protein